MNLLVIVIAETLIVPHALPGRLTGCI